MDGNLDAYLNQFLPKKRKSGDESVARVVDDELAKLGWSPNARLSFLGDVGRENGWNRQIIFGGHTDPASYTKGRGKIENRGIISWNADRKTKLDNYLKKQGVLGRNDDDELRAMVRFADEEMRSSPEWKKIADRMRDPNISTYDASENLRKYIKYVPEAPYNTFDKEFRVKNNADWARKAQKLGLGQATSSLDDYLSQFVTPESPDVSLDNYLDQFSEDNITNVNAEEFDVSTMKPFAGTIDDLVKNKMPFVEKKPLTNPPPTFPANIAPEPKTETLTPPTRQYAKREIKPGESYFEFEKTGKSGDLEYLGMADGKYYARNSDGDEFELEQIGEQARWKPTSQFPKKLGGGKYTKIDDTGKYKSDDGDEYQFSIEEKDGEKSYVPKLLSENPKQITLDNGKVLTRTDKAVGEYTDDEGKIYTKKGDKFSYNAADWLAGKTEPVTEPKNKETYEIFRKNYNLKDTEELRKKYNASYEKGFSKEDQQILNSTQPVTPDGAAQSMKASKLPALKSVPEVARSYNFEETGVLELPMTEKGVGASFKYDKANQQNLKEGEYRVTDETGNPFIFNPETGTLQDELQTRVVKEIPIDLPERGSITASLAKRAEGQKVADALYADNIISRDEIDEKTAVEFFSQNIRDFNTQETLPEEKLFKFFDENKEIVKDTYYVTERDINRLKEYSAKKKKMESDYSQALGFYQNKESDSYIAETKAKMEAGMIDRASGEKELAEYQARLEKTIQGMRQTYLGNEGFQGLTKADIEQLAQERARQTLTNDINTYGSMAGKIEAEQKWAKLSTLEKSKEIGKSFLKVVPDTLSAIYKTAGIAESGLRWLNSATAGNPEWTPVDKTYLYYVGDIAEDFRDAYIPQRPEARESYLATAANGFGQVLSQAFAAYTSGGMTLPTAMIASQGFSGQYDEAKKKGATEGQRFLAGIVGIGAAAPDILITRGWFKGLTNIEKAGFISNLSKNLYANLSKKYGEAEAKSLVAKAMQGFFLRAEQIGGRWFAKETLEEAQKITFRVAGKNVLKGTVKESAQEFGENKINKIAEKYIYNPKVTWTEIASITDEDIHSIIGGLAGGAFGGGLQSYVQFLQQKRTEEASTLLKELLDKGEIDEREFEKIKAVGERFSTDPNAKEYQKPKTLDYLKNPRQALRQRKRSIDAKSNKASFYGEDENGNDIVETFVIPPELRPLKTEIDNLVYKVTKLRHIWFEDESNEQSKDELDKNNELLEAKETELLEKLRNYGINSEVEPVAETNTIEPVVQAITNAKKGDSDDVSPEPERDVTLTAQRKAMLDRKKSSAIGVLYTDDERVPDVEYDWIKEVSTPSGVLHVSIPKLKNWYKGEFNREEVLSKLESGEIPVADILGKAYNAKDTSVENNPVSVVTTDKNGNELTASVIASPEQAEEQAELDKQRFGNEAESAIVPTAEVIDSRRENRPINTDNLFEDIKRETKTRVNRFAPETASRNEPIVSSSTEKGIEPEQISGVFQNMGGAIGENLRASLWDKVQNGETKELGTESNILKIAKKIRENGGLQTKEEFDRFTNDFGANAANKSGQELAQAANELFKKYTKSQAQNVSQPAPMRESVVDLKNGNKSRLELRATGTGIIISARDDKTLDVQGELPLSQNSDGTWSVPREKLVQVIPYYRRQGIATAMYDFAEDSGYRVKRSSEQRGDGRAFWDNREGKKTGTDKISAKTNTAETAPQNIRFGDQRKVKTLELYNNAAQVFDRDVYKDHVNPNTQKEADRLLRAIENNDLASLQKSFDRNKKHLLEMQGGGGSGPGKVFRPDTAKATIAREAEKAIRTFSANIADYPDLAEKYSAQVKPENLPEQKSDSALTKNEKSLEQKPESAQTETAEKVGQKPKREKLAEPTSVKLDKQSLKFAKRNKGRLSKLLYNTEVKGDKIIISSKPSNVSDIESDIVNAINSAEAERIANRKPSKPREANPETQGLQIFVRNSGGIRPDKSDLKKGKIGGELSYLTVKEGGLIGLVNRNSDRNAEQMAQWAFDAGYFLEYKDYSEFNENVPPDEFLRILRDEPNRISVHNKAYEDIEKSLEDQEFEYYEKKAQKELENTPLFLGLPEIEEIFNSFDFTAENVKLLKERGDFYGIQEQTIEALIAAHIEANRAVQGAESDAADGSSDISQSVQEAVSEAAEEYLDETEPDTDDVDMSFDFGANVEENNPQNVYEFDDPREAKKFFRETFGLDEQATGLSERKIVLADGTIFDFENPSEFNNSLASDGVQARYKKRLTEAEQPKPTRKLEDLYAPTQGSLIGADMEEGLFVEGGAKPLDLFAASPEKQTTKKDLQTDFARQQLSKAVGKDLAKYLTEPVSPILKIKNAIKEDVLKNPQFYADKDTGLLTEPLMVLSRLKTNNKSVEEYLEQAGLFGGAFEELNPAQKEFLQNLETADDAGIVKEATRNFLSDASTEDKDLSDAKTEKKDESLSGSQDLKSVALETPQREIDAVELVKDKDGNLLAPNGKPSLLNEHLWKTVRTPLFLNWFGDWINSPESASKVVDLNGEPLIVYHGRSADFDRFNKKYGGKYTSDNGKLGFFFTADANLASDFTRRDWENKTSKHRAKANLVPSFLAIKNPQILSARQFVIFEQPTKRLKQLEENKQDGFIINPIKTDDRPNWHFFGEGVKEFDEAQYVAVKPNQIKSIFNRGTFSRTEDSILKKIRDTESQDFYTNVLPYTSHETVLGRLSGGEIVDGRLTGNEFDFETIRRLVAEDAFQRTGKEVRETSFEGIVLDNDKIARIVKIGRESGFENENLTKLLDNLEQLAKENDRFSALYLYDDALPEELVHLDDFRAGRTDAEAKNALTRHPLFTNPGAVFTRQYGSQSIDNQISEMAAKLATDQAERYGWTEIDNFDNLKNEFLTTWAQGFLRRNKIDSSEKFNDFIEKYENIGQYAKYEENQQRGSRENRGSESTQGSSARGSGETVRQTETGREKTDQSLSESEINGRKKAAFSRILGTDYYYDPQSHEQTKAKAEQLLSTEENVSSAAWKVLNDSKPSAEAMQVVYWELERLNGLADSYLEEGKDAEFSAVAAQIAELSAAIVQRQVATGQEVEIAKTLAALSPEAAILTAQKIKAYAREGAQLTKPETETITRIQGDLRKANEKLQTAQRKLNNANATIRRMKDEREKQPRRNTTAQDKLLKQYKAKEKDILAALREKFPDSPMFNGMEAALKMVAWHGSPHRFDKFDISKIGTGEGRQAYGYGLYFAGREEVADHYKKLLGDGALLLNGKSITEQGDNPVFSWVRQYMSDGLTANQAVEKVEKQLDDKEWLAKNTWVEPTIKKALPVLKSGKLSIDNTGAKYKVDLKPSEDEYLLWDKPLSEQSEKVKKALDQADRIKLGNDFKVSQWQTNDYSKNKLRGEHIIFYGKIQIGKQETSEYLKSLGIRGIKYLDGSSRGKGEGNYNYVIFDDADIEITETLYSKSDTPIDAETQKLLTEYAVGQILQGMDYQTLIDTLSDISGADMPTIRQIHSDAVNIIKPAPKPMTESAKQKVKIRNEHYEKASAFEKGLPETKLSGIAQDALSNGLSDEIVFAVNLLTGDEIKSINNVIGAIAKEFNVSPDRAREIAQQAKTEVAKIRAERRKAADEAKNITVEQRAALNEAIRAKGKATYELNKFLSSLARLQPPIRNAQNVVTKVLNEYALINRRNNNVLRAAFINNWMTQLRNVMQAATITMPVEHFLLDVLETSIKTTGLNVGDSPDIRLQDIWLPLAYTKGANRQLAELALSFDPEIYFKIMNGLQGGDVELENAAYAPEAVFGTKTIHKALDLMDRFNDKMSHISGAKFQEHLFRTASFGATVDQIIRHKSKGAYTLKDVLENPELNYRDYITEKNAEFAADKALSVTYASAMDDPMGRKLKQAYDKLDYFLPLLFNPVTYARFTYATTKIAVANPLLFGALDAKAMGGKGYSSRSIAKGVLGWSGVVIAYALMSAFGGDDDKWNTLKFGDTWIDVKYLFPLSSYFYVAHLIKSAGKGTLQDELSYEKLLEGFASLELDYFNYGAGMEFLKTVKGNIAGTKTLSDTRASSARLLGSYFSGLLRFVKPAKDILSAFDKEERYFREYDDSAKDKFVKEMAKSLPGLARAYNAPVQTDAVTDEKLEAIYPILRPFGINIIHPSFIAPEDSAATVWANKLFAQNFGDSSMTAEERRAYAIRKRLRNAVRSNEITPEQAAEKIKTLVKEMRLTEKSGDRLADELKYSELGAKIKQSFGMEDKGDVEKLRTVWSYTTDAEKDELRKILNEKKGRTDEFDEEFGLSGKRKDALKPLPDRFKSADVEEAVELYKENADKFSDKEREEYLDRLWTKADNSARRKPLTDEKLALLREVMPEYVPIKRRTQRQSRTRREPRSRRQMVRAQ